MDKDSLGWREPKAKEGRAVILNEVAWLALHDTSSCASVPCLYHEYT